MKGGGYHAEHLEMRGNFSKAISEWLKRELEKWRDEMKKKERQPPIIPGVLNLLWLERLSKL